MFYLKFSFLFILNYSLVQLCAFSDAFIKSQEQNHLTIKVGATTLEAGVGQGWVSQFIVGDDAIISNEQQVDMRAYGTNLDFIFNSGETYVLDFLPLNWGDIHNFSISHLDVGITSHHSQVSFLDFGYTNLDNSGLEIPHAALSCSGLLQIPQTIQEFLDPCLQTGQLDVDLITLYGSSQENTHYRDFRISIRRGELHGQILLDEGRFRFRGEIFAYEDKITLRVDRVSLGVLPITGMFFRRLADADVEFLEVERPYIHVPLSLFGDLSQVLRESR